MQWIFTVTPDGGPEMVFEVDRPGRHFCILGREGADFVLPDPYCSRFHAVIYLARDGKVHLRDLNSHNGTHLAGQRVQEVELTEGDEFRIGHHWIQVELSETLNQEWNQTLSDSSEWTQTRSEIKERPQTDSDSIVTKKVDLLLVQEGQRPQTELAPVQSPPQAMVGSPGPDATPPGTPPAEVERRDRWGRRTIRLD